MFLSRYLGGQHESSDKRVLALTGKTGSLHRETEAHGGTALVLGISGQDGWYVTRTLCEAGVTVYGVSRSKVDASLLRAGGARLAKQSNVDLTDYVSLKSIVESVAPDFVINLAGFTHVGASWEQPEESWRGNVKIVETLVRIFSEVYGSPEEWPFLYHSSSSEVFGSPSMSPQDEKTPFAPITPYGEHKVVAHRMLWEKREQGATIAIGIPYNHESPRRPERFVSRKISSTVAGLSLGTESTLHLGSLAPKRDWSFAGDYAEAVREIVFGRESQDFIIASGVEHSVRDFVATALDFVGLKDRWDLVVADSFSPRSREPEGLVGDWAKLAATTGWRPKTSFKELVTLMVQSDLDRLRSSRADSDR